MKQTAVNWMANELLHLDNEFDMGLIIKTEYQIKRKSIIGKAKQMEKEQIESAWIDGVTNWDSEKVVEDYINETFKSE